MPDQWAKQLHWEIGHHLDEITRLFKDPVKITIIIRNQVCSDGSRDVLLTDEKDIDIEVAIEAIRRIVKDQTTLVVKGG